MAAERDYYFPHAFFDAKEREVAEILLCLPDLVYQSKRRQRCAVAWVEKRRRSMLNLRPAHRPSTGRRPPLSCSPPPVESETEKRPKVKTEASSPATPLSFSPSESDELSKPKQNHTREHNKPSKKRKREEWLEDIEKYSRLNGCLRKQMKVAMDDIKQLKSSNTELKAMQKELKERFPHLETCEGPSPKVGDGQIGLLGHQEPSVLDDHMASASAAINRNPGCPRAPTSPFFSFALATGSGMVNQVGPLGLPDLNLSPEEALGLDAYQPLDDRARAADARKRRMIRMREMKSSRKHHHG